MRLLIEIGVEELPAIPFLKELKNIVPKWKSLLDVYGLESKFEFEFTPRRLMISGEIPEFSKDIEAEFIGAPKAVALQNGTWSAAAKSFANKCGISEAKLEFKDIKGKEVLYYKSVQKGKLASELLPEMISKFVSSLNFGKSMRWGSGEYEFIRPIRSLICMLDNESVECELMGVKSDKAFYPHRRYGYEPIKFNTIDEYFELLPKFGIMLKSTDRKAKILSEFKEIEASSGLKIELDFELLDEVVAITEFPTALLGTFEKEFLEVPSEVIITSMKENQRYFPLHDKNEKLSNHFVVVSNALSDDKTLIVKGNEKVLRARLSDAKFFWESDLAAEFSSEKLKQISYLNELGSMYDKEIRERFVARTLSGFYDKELKIEFDGDYEHELDRAVMLSKADLTTGMVYEFTNLQGIMGAYYAAYRRENPFIVEALREQYLPSGEGSKCPRTLFASIVAVSNKLDTLMGLFSINKIPSGTKDPYALRRAASGLIKIVLNLGINFDVKTVLNAIKSNYKEFDISLLENFIYDRLYSMQDANPSVVKACINSGESDIKKLNLNILALNEICKKDDFKESFSTFKRLANIIKDAEICTVNEALFEEESEKELNSKFKSLNLDEENAKDYLESLFGLKPDIDKFFDSVMINHENESIKANRKALIGQIYKAFLRIADIKEISN